MIRDYDAADRDTVVEVWARATELAHPFLDAAFLARERRDIAEVHLQRARTWVWGEDGAVRGFLALLGHEVGAVFVDPAWQGRGIGRALMATAQDGRPPLELEVFEQNHIGRAFNDRLGFTFMERKVHAPTGQPLLRLRKNPD